MCPSIHPSYPRSGSKRSAQLSLSRCMLNGFCLDLRSHHFHAMGEEEYVLVVTRIDLNKLRWGLPLQPSTT